jgi:hypothetical protein
MLCVPEKKQCSVGLCVDADLNAKIATGGLF